MNETKENVSWGVWLEEIPPEGLKIDFEDLRDIEDVKVTKPFSGSLFIRKRGIEVLVEGFINGEIELICDLCLVQFPYKIEKDFEVLLLPKQSLNFEGEKELTSEELEISFYENSFIDYLNILHEEILLNIPYRSLCKEDCKGLCPKCGANLNKESCNCIKVKRSSPFAILKDFKILQEKAIDKEV